MIQTQPLHAILSTNNPIVDVDYPSANKPCALSSVLASVVAETADEPDTSLPRFTPSKFTAAHLAQKNLSLVGMCVHLPNRRGELMRRGIVVKETLSTVLVCFADPLTGIVANKTTVYSKHATGRWKWYAGIDESNAAYVDVSEELQHVI